jgi:hypothetical protein
MMNRSEDSGHPCLISDFRGNGFSFSPLSMMLAIGLSYIACIMLKDVPSIPSFLRDFIIKWCWSLSRLFLHLLRWSSGFCLHYYECAILHLFICICWTIPVSLGWSQLGNGEWSFWYVVGFGWPLFYWGFLH